MAVIHFLRYEGRRQLCDFDRCKGNSEFMLKKEGSPRGMEIRMCRECAMGAAKGIIEFFKKELEEQEREAELKYNTLVAQPVEQQTNTQAEIPPEAETAKQPKPQTAKSNKATTKKSGSNGSTKKSGAKK